MRGLLVLADGSVYQGKAFGAAGRAVGEVVFNTSMTGYQEILTDPSYCGQIVTMTYPLIGNYGINGEDMESCRIHARGMVVKTLCDYPNNWRQQGRLEEFLHSNGVVGVAGVDTRAITRKLRSQGTLRGVVAAGEWSVAELLELTMTGPAGGEKPVVEQVTSTQIRYRPGPGPRVVVMDFGVKENILRWLGNLGFDVIVVPAGTGAKEIMSLHPAGILLSNGPGDPKEVGYAVRTIRQLMETRVPMFGICLGHQLMGLAMGGDTYKLPFGHRGGNHPVQDLATGRVYITSQNHGYALAENTLPASNIHVTHRNINDGTVEGITHRYLPAFSVQYHPESSPGPTDSEYLFQRFKEMIQHHTQ